MNVVDKITMSEFISGQSQTASWFEFLLNPTLLDTFLTEDNLEVTGTDLIIQFLISANLIEQKTKLKTATENPNDIELKDNRIRALRHLAMKIAAKLNWDLTIIEKRIPVAVASDLIHCFVRLTTQSDKNYKDREQLQQLNKLQEPALFAVQLLHRWTVRTCVQSSFPTKPVKIFQVNVAGYVNPLQHMRGPNENVIEMARVKVRESIQALEALLEWKSVVRIPVDACFDLVDIENGTVPCDWSRTQVYPLVECVARIAYDLGTIYFYEQNYLNAHTMFRRVADVRNQLQPTTYFSSLDGYLTSLNSINPSMEPNLLQKSKERFLIGIPSPRTSIDDYILMLGDDNETKEMTMAARHRLEDRLEIGSQQYRVVCSFNLVRSLLDGKHVSNTQYAFDYLDKALQSLKQVPLKQQSLLNSFLKIHFHKLPKTLQDQLRSNNLTHLVGSTFSAPVSRSKTFESVPRSTLLDRPNSSIQFKCQTRLIHSTEPEVLTQMITDLENAKSIPILEELFPPSFKQTFTDQAINMLMNSNHLLGHVIRIIYNKAKRAQSYKNYSQSYRSLTQAIDLLKSFHHQDLCIEQVIKCLQHDRLLFNLYEVISRQTFPENENSLWMECQNFLMKNHSETDIDTDLVSAILAYALSRNEIQFLQSLNPTVRRMRPYLDIANLFARLLSNENQPQIRPELARELWERISDILSEKLQELPGGRPSRNRHQQTSTLNEKLTVVELQKFLLNLNHPILLQILFSLLSRLYSLVLVDQSHIDIYSEYSRYWPTSIDYRQRSIRSSILAQLIQILSQHIQTREYLPIQAKSSLLRTQADLHLTLQQYTQAMHAYISAIGIETGLFSSPTITQQDDALIRNMIKAALQLGYHTQVACMCQLLSVPDYNTIFKTLQENYMNDDIDDYYECIWDLALLESLINNLNLRGYEDKKRLAIRICKQKDLNGNNSDEIRFRMTRVKRRLLLKQLLAHYLLPHCRLYRSRTLIKSQYQQIHFD
ncbi:unnamed protein product [Adineta ricciae]|uniref:INTS8 TPR repeats domain-containing protein n=1 Tax=Adineta ricciae TaxID=249248 RepID=A0A816AMS8_ADIRI|nr:unnamed protein product [Adineta ricciae]